MVRPLWCGVVPDAVVVGAGLAARFALARLDAGRYVRGDHRDFRSVQGGRRAARAVRTDLLPTSGAA